MVAAAESSDRSTVNALFGDNPLKLGLFGMNNNRACTMSLSPDVPFLTWENTKNVAQLVDCASSYRVRPHRHQTKPI